MHTILIALLGVPSHEHVTSLLPRILKSFLTGHLLPLMMDGYLLCTQQNLNLALYHLGFDHVPLLIWAMLFKLLWPIIQKTCCMILTIFLASLASRKPVSLTLLNFTPNFLFLTFFHPFYGMIGIHWNHGQPTSQLTLLLIFSKLFHDCKTSNANAYIYLPFRLPSLSEKAKDSELSELLIATIEDASPPLFTLHNIIGNFF